MVNGIINVYKEKGYTSFDVVAKMRGIFGQKKTFEQGSDRRIYPLPWQGRQRDNSQAILQQQRGEREHRRFSAVAKEQKQEGAFRT